MNTETTALIFGAAWGIVGYVIGTPRGRGPLAFAAGFLFGPLGLAVALLMPPVRQINGWWNAATQRTERPDADWYDDPRGRYEYRYFDGKNWTCYVASDGIASVEPGFV